MPLPSEEDLTRAEQQRDELEQHAAALFVGAVLVQQTLSESDDRTLRDLVRQALAWHYQALTRLFPFDHDDTDVAMLSRDVVDRIHNRARGHTEDIRGWVADQPDRQPGETPLRLQAATGLATYIYNASLEAVARSSGKTSVRKIWVTRADRRVRPLHRRLHGASRPLGEPFITWPAASLSYPGDLDAPLSATIGCRCVLVYSTAPAQEITDLFPPLPDEGTEDD